MIAKDLSPSWLTLRPRFQAMLFALGYRDVRRLTGVSVGQVYELVNGRSMPQRRTLRDIDQAVRAWESERDSETERSAR